MGKAEFSAWPSSAGHSTRSEAEAGRTGIYLGGQEEGRNQCQTRTSQCLHRDTPAWVRWVFLVVATEDKRENPDTGALRKGGRWRSQRPRSLMWKRQGQEHGETDSLGEEREGREAMKELRDRERQRYQKEMRDGSQEKSIQTGNPR